MRLRVRIELAAGKFELARKMFTGFKYGIGNRDYYLHSYMVSPWYDHSRYGA
jgi:hypothetical protein